MLAGVPVITGGVVSQILTVKEAVTELARLSVAMHVTVVVPTINLEPEGGVHTTVTAPSTISEAVGGEYDTTLPPSVVAS
jgi:hypothetical protein